MIKDRTALGRGEGCECDWIEDAHAYDWTHCPVHFEAEQAAYDKWRARMPSTQRIQAAGEEEMAVADRAVLVVLRQGSATPHGPEAAQAKEIVNGVASWTITDHETLELYSTAKELVATFRDWSFVKFMDAKSGA